MRLVTSWHDYPAAIVGVTERRLLNWFTREVAPGDTWLDVGAHYGYTAMALANLVTRRGRVFAFEPIVTTAGCMAQTRTLNHLKQMTVVPMALADMKGIELRRLATVRGMADLCWEHEHGEQRATGHDTIIATGLDWIWPSLCGGNSRIDGIKIDVQGMEIQALTGMARIVAEHRPKLVVELHRGVDRGEFLSLLQTLGYSRQAVPIESAPDETVAKYMDDRSYAFVLASAADKGSLRSSHCISSSP